ncbi:hypothetical protein [Lewinella sp. IMCC34183]|uniref:hypothetical protein n=1 Tax=Lewinella sp. IMCC34183 TaxID=2248762 RepID=UPI000E27B33B|nr:hypothetical protein [Lewinella sp. IMCC34183]
MNKITLVLNAGRSGSTYLEHLLRTSFARDCYIAHEDIPVQVSKPKLYNRAYTAERREEVLADKSLRAVLSRWEAELKKHPVIETGWTSYHLCPVLLEIFGEQLQIIVMHRDPVSFAFSRANMGNYHPHTFYDSAHEVSPFDAFSIAPQKRGQWAEMNHFERCMYWWWVIYQEGLEFLEKHPEVPHKIVKSKEIFSLERLDEVLAFMQLDPAKLKTTEVEQNPLAQFMRETFPVGEEWRNYEKHPDILAFAEELGGYRHSTPQLEKTAQKYKLPDGLGPLVRNRIHYWKLKAQVRRLLKPQ